MQRRDLLWVFAYPIYQVIGTLRHESAHALAAIAFGGVIEEFVFLPTQGYWGYVSWTGPSNLFTTGAPYLLDLLTFIVFFSLCMLVPFRRRWIWLNLVILGVVSPLVNSAYNYNPNMERWNDVDHLLSDGNTILTHGYFLTTLLLYLIGLIILFTRAKIIRKSNPSRLTWTSIPFIVGVVLLSGACSWTLQDSIRSTEQAANAVQDDTPPPPSPVVRSATMTPTMTPAETYEEIRKQVLTLVAAEYPERGPGIDLVWEGDYRVGPYDPNTTEGEFFAGDWKFRLFDWKSEDPSDAVDVYVNNKSRFFYWSGTARLDQINGQLSSGGVVPKPDTGSSEWMTYTNERYGYRFQYPSDVDVIEHGVAFFETGDVPEGMTSREYGSDLVRQMGPNLCVQVMLGDGYIWFNPPENFGARFNHCGRMGPGAPGWIFPDRSETINIEGQTYTLEGHEIIKIEGEGDEHDEALRLELPSGMHIEVGAYTYSEQSYQRYRENVLPALIAILETYETIPRSTAFR